MFSLLRAVPTLRLAQSELQEILPLAHLWRLPLLRQLSSRGQLQANFMMHVSDDE
jgi:hypothetical protein